MLVHCLVGAGFLSGSLIVRPFLPADTVGEKRDFQTVCKDANTTETDNNITGNALEDVVDDMWGLPSIYWPYIIMGCVVVLSSWCFLPLALCTSKRKFKMPVYISEEQIDEVKEVILSTICICHNHSSLCLLQDYSKLWKWAPVLVMISIFYILSCGIERIFQSTVFTFGLCGPLKLDPQQSAISDNSYNGGFVAGRVVGTLVAGFLKPRNMLVISLIFNLGSAIIMAIFASTSVIGNGCTSSTYLCAIQCSLFMYKKISYCCVCSAIKILCTIYILMK